MILCSLRNHAFSQIFQTSVYLRFVLMMDRLVSICAFLCNKERQNQEEFKIDFIKSQINRKTLQF